MSEIGVSRAVCAYTSERLVEQAGVDVLNSVNQQRHLWNFNNSMETIARAR